MFLLSCLGEYSHFDQQICVQHGFFRHHFQREDPTYYIWLLDISGPAQAARNNWGDLKEAGGEGDPVTCSDDLQ